MGGKIEGTYVYSFWPLIFVTSRIFKVLQGLGLQKVAPRQFHMSIPSSKQVEEASSMQSISNKMVPRSTMGMSEDELCSSSLRVRGLMNVLLHPSLQYKSIFVDVVLQPIKEGGYGGPSN